MTYKVDVRLDAGSVDVFAEPRDNPVATVEPDDGSDASREAAANTRVELRGDTLIVHGPKTRRWVGRTPRLRVEIRTPVDSTLSADLASASLACHGRLLDVRVKSASGDVELEQMTGDARLDSASGHIRIGQVDGDLRAETASGRITAVRVGGSVRAKTASGEVEIGDAGAGLYAETVAGDVRLGPLRKGQVKAKTVSGDVTVGVVTGTGVWLDVQTMTGATRTDLDLNGREAPPSGHDLTVGVRTVSGDIEVSRAPQPATTPVPGAGR